MKTEKAKKLHNLSNKKCKEIKKQNNAIYIWLMKAGLMT